MKIRTIIIAVFSFIQLVTINLTFSQNVGFNTTGSLPNSSALLDIDASPLNNKGLLIPRVSLIQTSSNAPIGATIATSLLVYNTATINDVIPGYYYWDGTTWVRLSTGAAGPTGPTGANGIDGVTGPQGPAGVNGINGVTGSQGPAGTNGLNGAAGPTGANGTNGIGGVTGATGPAGANGTNGLNGVTGPTGVAGSTGTNGTNGINGVTGPTGSTGVAGVNGTNGTNGLNGATGPTGANGTNGLNGVTGPTGVAGSTGTNGTNGINGVTGPTGSTGVAGTNGITGPTGATGPIGCGVANFVVKSNGTSAVCSQIIDNGTNVGVNTAVPDASALIEFSSTTKGTLITRMTTIQRNAIIAPATGLMIFNTTTNCLEFYVGGWQPIACGCVTAPAVPAAISGSNSVCASQVGVIYSIAAVTGATSYTWTVPAGSSIVSGQGTNTITVNFGSTSGNISVTASNSCGISAASNIAVVVTSPPAAPGIITGLNSVTSGQVGVVYSIAAVAGATSYTWTVPAGASVTAGQGTISATVTFGATAGNVCVTATNACGTSAAICLGVAISSCTGSQTFVYTGAMQTFTVPACVTSLTIEVWGAQGGSHTSSLFTGGNGARMKGTFTVVAGQQLNILVGQFPGIASNGGGGGSFVTTNTNTPLIIAGGGGGSSDGFDAATKHGSIATNGQPGANSGGAGGAGGNGGLTGGTTFDPGSGGGLSTNGLDGTSVNAKGMAFVNGGAGGTVNGLGGYGGGGSGSLYVVGGGGGGYSGGGSGGFFGTGGVGGGGGSFNSGTAQSNTTGAQTGNGQVIITW